MVKISNKNKKILAVVTISLLMCGIGAFMVYNIFGNLTGKTIDNLDDSNSIEDTTPTTNLGNNINLSTPIVSTHGGGGGGSSGTVIIPEVQWQEVYSYEDEYSQGGFAINTSNKEIEVSRAYVWRAEFGTVFNGKIEVVSSNDKYSWYGSRLALVDENNIMRRYEIRLLPSEDKVEVRYVDRTNRTGTFSGFDEDTISELLTSVNCNIEIGTSYDINIIKNENTWKAQIFSLTNPTCFVEWEDNRISQDRMAIGIQSAGKYVVSRFDTIVAI